MRSALPRVAVVDRLPSADESGLLIDSARPLLRGLRATDPPSGAAIALPVRTSSDAAMDPLVEDLALRLVQLRIAASAGLELVHAEHLTVLRYAPGEQYRPHRDCLPPAAIARDRPQAGNRRRTICVYLNGVQAGGETEFPGAGVRVAPVAGSAALFDNLHDDGAPDVDSLHAGLPVQRGGKWLAVAARTRLPDVLSAAASVHETDAFILPPLRGQAALRAALRGCGSKRDAVQKWPAGRAVRPGTGNQRAAGVKCRAFGATQRIGRDAGPRRRNHPPTSPAASALRGAWPCRETCA